jgi:hypothetical protein
MHALIGLSPSALRKAANIQEQILELQSKLNHLLGQPVPTSNVEASDTSPKSKKRKLSAAGLAAIRAGVKKRMAHKHGGAEIGSVAKKPKRKGNAARSAAAKAVGRPPKQQARPASN